MGLKNVVLDKKAPVNAKQKSERLLKMGGGGKDQTQDLKDAFKQKDTKKATPFQNIVTKVVT